MSAVASGSTRTRFLVAGSVQGVGFRPFVHRLAYDLSVSGFVRNSSAGAEIEAEGSTSAVAEFQRRLERDTPPPCSILEIRSEQLHPAGYTRFDILASKDDEPKTAAILPDLAICDQCHDEILLPSERRYRYAFTNCTRCGPRFTIVRALPYDRANTTMDGFRMCAACGSEYENPRDRRFHAQPVACPTCGPQLSLFAGGNPVHGDPIVNAAGLIRKGKILALKGVGGFQLLVDATNPSAVQRLRDRKGRGQKPFAVLFSDLQSVSRHCIVDPIRAGILQSPAAPIVLLQRLPTCEIASQVSSASKYIGCMLPYSPLHCLLIEAIAGPVVATSGNRSEEPIAIDNDEAIHRLAEIADAFLMHDRPIERPMDDSVVLPFTNQSMVIRRARGFTPAPVVLNRPLPRILALGAHLKSTIAIGVGRNAVISQHLGDLDSVETRNLFQRTVVDLRRLYGFSPDAVACDLHPDYYSTLMAPTFGVPVIGIQHHQAHLASCAAENGLDGPYLGVAWDGNGAGTDGTVWGGEFLLRNGAAWERFGHLRPFRLIGGESAVRDARRVAFSLTQQAGETVQLRISTVQRAAWTHMHGSGLQSPVTTSMGRLFDAVACIAGLAERNSFEGHLPMLLERETGESSDETYPWEWSSADANFVIDWRPTIAALMDDVKCELPVSVVFARFQNTLAEWVLAAARHARTEFVVLSGGCFQNAYLLERVCHLLSTAGFRPVVHRRIPPNDAGISLGQLVLAAERL